MKTKGYITIKNKKYSYTLTKKDSGVIHFDCLSAKINQDFLAEDASLLLLDLPNLIIAEQDYKINKNETIRFRISTKDKQEIERKAIQNGYSSVSKYLKDLALS